MTSVQVTNPVLPFWDAIPLGLSVGKVIEIQGLFPAAFDVSNYSQINLCERSPDTIHLHISIRFNHRVVVRNTLHGNSWQHEERGGPFPFAEGRQFSLQIVVKSHGYQISVNGQHCWTYNHRLAYSGVTHLNICGPLMIWKVEYKSNAQVQMANFKFSPAKPAKTRLATSPCLPFWGTLPQRLGVGSIIEVKGSFPKSIDRSQYTQVNLCQDSHSNIAFHLSIRFNYNEAIRNTKRHGNWETEEKGGPFPFVLGKEFLIKIVVQSHDYQISVNGAYCWSFPHRMPFGAVNAVSIDGPVNIQNIYYTSSMDQMPQQQPTYSPPSPVPVSPQPSTSLDNVYNPVLPFSYHISGGIKPNMMIYISGIPFVNFHKFTVSLQCGQQQRNPDVAFQLDVRGYSGTVVRNTSRNNRWEDEETAAPYFPFHPCVPFDMMILVQSDKFMVAVNGTHFIQYYHRMSRFTKINILKIENDVTITSVRFSK